MLKIKSLLLTALAAISMPVMAANVDLSKAQDETFEYLLNEKLNAQKVIVSAPGMPSQLHDMAMVAEDPNAKENQNKAYHPVELQGWNTMIAQGRLLEGLGMMSFESGTFEELDYQGKKFKFTGHLMKFTAKAKDYIAIFPTLRRVGLKVGVMGVDKIVSFTKTQIKEGKPTVLVDFTTALYDKSPWLSDEYLKATGIMSFVEGKTQVKMTYSDGKWQIADEKFLMSVQNPVVDFE